VAKLEAVPAPFGLSKRENKMRHPIYLGATLAVLAAAVPVLAAAPSAAQTLGIGSTKAGAVAQITATISKVVSESEMGLQLRSQTMGGTQQYIPVVNAGEMAFGISNIPQ
jgi:hypothetical protein